MMQDRGGQGPGRAAGLLPAGFGVIALLAACGGGGDAPSPRAAEMAVVVTGADLPFTMADGAAAKQVADAQCGPGGVKTSIYDRFDNGAWVYPEGCA